ncbi:FAD-dependent oxidoreductase [Actinoplanes sp. GCM10030250]|uniref:GcvT family protein n=1 Tax=Actinoplanes sp. GCM10030250 TaxID=3273376 RepID=UPI00360C5FE8
MAGPRVVIIGAGVVGCALADELTGRGWTNVTVLDQGPLPVTGGSSSHSPGLVFQTDPSRTMTRLARYTTMKYAELGCFSPVGSLEVATTPERLAELHRRFGFGQSWGVPSSIVDPADCVSLFPLLDPSVVLGGLHVPGDGLISATRAVEVQAARAESRGARFVGNSRVVKVATVNGRVTGVSTADDDYAADVVVSCAGFWGPAIGELAGVGIPLLPMAHQYVRTTPAGGTDDLPILRHPDRGLSFRAHGDRLGVGSHPHDPMPVELADLPGDAHPAMLPFTPAAFKQSWSAATELLPALRGTAFDDAFDGVLAVTADGFPLLGEALEPRGLWVAEAVRVTHAAGAAKALAEWLIDGRTGIDLHECDLNRFDRAQLAPAYVRKRAMRGFAEAYGIVHPQDPPAVRNLRLSPFHQRQAELGAVFGEAGGWEKPLWYGSNPPPEELRPRDEWSSRHWSPISETEARLTRRRVALFDTTSLTRLEVIGPAAFLTALTGSDADVPVGTVVPALLLDPAGGVRSDITMARLGADRFEIGAHGPLDLDWLLRHAPAGVTVRDVTGGTCALGVWGPRAPELVAPLTGIDLAADVFGPLQARQGYLGMVPVTMLRVPGVGEAGWEIRTAAEYGPRLWDTLWQAGPETGLIAAGRIAYDSLRLERGFRIAGTDMTTEDDPFQSGLGFAAGDRPRPATPPERQLTCLVVAETGDVPMGHEPVYAGGFAVGHVTSAGYGHTVAAPIAYAWLPTALSVPGTQVEIGYFDRRLLATVTAEPLSDLTQERLRR